MEGLRFRVIGLMRVLSGCGLWAYGLRVEVQGSGFAGFRGSWSIEAPAGLRPLYRF